MIFPSSGRCALTRLRQAGCDARRMEFTELTLPQQVAAHELEIRSLRGALRHQEHLFAMLIDLVELPPTSPECMHLLKALRAERDAIRQAQDL